MAGLEHNDQSMELYTCFFSADQKMLSQILLGHNPPGKRSQYANIPHLHSPILCPTLEYAMEYDKNAKGFCWATNPFMLLRSLFLTTARNIPKYWTSSARLTPWFTRGIYLYSGSYSCLHCIIYSYSIV